MPCETEKKNKLKTLLAQRALLCSSKNNADLDRVMKLISI